NLHDEWWQLVTQYLADSGLEIPQNNASPANGRHQHTPHLTTLLNEMQSVARLDPQARW
ncbi:MAG: phenylacetate-CoA oxygenase subunit PaaI, partial [Chloroflexi bacterium]|nr:phenylacetate-CoA oxygenase subunit PaaI [Chloroflexota bacterium]